MNNNYQFIIHVLQGLWKTFRSRVTKKNCLNLYFMENKISSVCTRTYPDFPHYPLFLLFVYLLVIVVVAPVIVHIRFHL